jgi:hypothetical protein
MGLTIYVESVAQESNWVFEVKFLCEGFHYDDI